MSKSIYILSRCRYSTLRTENFAWRSHEPIEKASTPPQEWYTNQDIHHRDHELLKQYPQYIGHMQQLTKHKGSYFAGNLLNEPFITIRQNETNETDKIGSFWNVCRHHASQLTQCTSGHIDCAKGLACPYHGWTYSIEGQLTKATQLKGIQDFKNKDYGLLSIPHHVLFNNLIFLNLSYSINHFERVIQSVTTYNDKNQFNNKHLIHVYSRKYLMQCNWKVFVENYLDGGYHVPFLHIGLNNNLNPDTYTTVIDDLVSFQSVKASSNVEESEQSGIDFAERIGDLGLYTYMYPNFMMNRYGRWMDINYVYPKNVNESWVHFDYFLEAEDVSGEMSAIGGEDGDLVNGVFYNLEKFDGNEVRFIKESIAASHQVQVEDTMICEAVQRGLNSNGYKSFGGRYAPQLETALYQFHQLYNKDMFA
eukprot:486021_1